MTTDLVPFNGDRLWQLKVPSSIGGLILMIGGNGQNGNSVEVITGKGKEVVRVEVDY